MTIELPYNYVPRNYQVKAWSYFERELEGLRGACVWHRRAGKDLLGINLCGVKLHQRVGTYWHILPTYKQGRNIVWNGFDREGRSFLSYFPDQLVAAKNATEMRLTFKNKSLYQVVGTDNIDSLVGTNPVGCIFSEFSLQDPSAWDYIRPILAENGGWALFIYTARGRNHGHSMYEMAKKNPKWFAEKLVAGSGEGATTRPDGSPVISDAIIDDERKAGMPEELIQQEFYCSFEAPMVGAYYGTQMERALRDGRIVDQRLYEPRIPVHTAWDLGVRDSTAIWFFQEIGNEVRVIDYYEASGESLAHYVNALRGRVEGREHMCEYTYGIHYAPFDIQVREFSSGKARIDLARELGIKFRVVKQHEVEDGVEVVRFLIPRCIFDVGHAQRGVDALRAYRKEWDETRKIFAGHPCHDWSSHGSDAFRILAMGIKDRNRDRRESPQGRAKDDYDYLAGVEVPEDGPRRGRILTL